MAWQQAGVGVSGEQAVQMVGGELYQIGDEFGKTLRQGVRVGTGVVVH